MGNKRVVADSSRCIGCQTCMAACIEAHDIPGNIAAPRLRVTRSNSNIYAQVIDDVQGVTLASASSMDKDFNAYGGNVEAAKKVGENIAKKCLEKGITEVVYDRGGFVYHGRVQALAEGAREAGLKL